MKTIYDQLEEEEKQVEQVENPVDEVDPVEIEDKEETEQKPETKPEEKPEVIEEPKVDTEAMARMRWENSELKRKQREADEAAQKAIQIANAEADPEPNKAEDREEWLEWKSRQQEKEMAELKSWKQQQEQERHKEQIVNEAIQEFNQYEARFAQTVPDYNDAAAFVQKRVIDSISLLNPNLSDQQIHKMAANQLLSMASNYVNNGIDPAAGIYHMAKKQGFVKQDVEVKPDPKPSLETVEKNKRKSAHGLSGTSGGKRTLTIADMEKMSTKEMYGYSDEEINGALYNI